MSEDSRKILVSDLSYDQDEIDAVIGILKSEWLTMGPKTIEFEKQLSGYLGANEVVAVSNGTAALHLGLLSQGVGLTGEVIVPPLSFVASANAILYTGAKPVFVDVSPETYNIDVQKIKDAITERTQAILPVHFAGLPAEMNAVNKIAKEYNLRVIDDAAHAIGAKYHGKSVGTLADVTAFSFFSNKNLSVGEGGAISTKDKSIADKLRLLRSHGLTKSTWSRHNKKDQESYDQLYDMVELGYNYRITEINAALGIVQLKKLGDFNKRREKIYLLYRDLLSDLPVELQSIPPNVVHSHHVLPVLVPEEKRALVRKKFEEVGIQTSIHYTPIHRFTYYQQHGYSNESYPVAEEIGRRVVTLPLHQKLTADDVHRVAAKLKEILKTS